MKRLWIWIAMLILIIISIIISIWPSIAVVLEILRRALLILLLIIIFFLGAFNALKKFKNGQAVIGLIITIISLSLLLGTIALLTEIF